MNSSVWLGLMWLWTKIKLDSVAVAATFAGQVTKRLEAR